MRLWLVTLVVTAQTAHAETIDIGHLPDAPAPAITLGSLGDPKLHVTTLRATATTLTIVLASSGSGHREATLPIDVPTGTRVRSLAVTIGNSTVTAQPMSGELARAAFIRELVPRDPRDPALLEQVAPDHLRLRVFPITRDAPATIAIGLELPAVGEIAIDPGPNKVARPKSITVAAATPWEAVPPPSNVDATTSLFAGPPESTRIPEIRFGGRPIYDVFIDKRSVRGVIKVHKEQLTECFQHELQFGHPDLAGRALLQFEIQTDGTVADVRVADDLGDPAVTSCLENEAASWAFSPSSSRTRINYPLTFTSVK